MVRTRAKNVKSIKTDTPEQSEEWSLWLMDFKNELDERLHKLKLKVNEEMESLDRSLLVMIAQIPEDELNAPPASSVNMDSYDSVGSFNSTLTTTVKKAQKGFVTSTAFKSIPAPPKTTRKSRAQTRLTRTSSLTDVSAVYPDLSSTRRVTRSSSQPRCALPITDYQTPMNRPDMTMKSVTPKVDPYCPMPLKRYARQGEMAISLTGSPLMMTTSITEPNISLPLNNGHEVYSILPTKGPCPEIPSIDHQTREKLKILRENLSKILGE